MRWNPSRPSLLCALILFVTGCSRSSAAATQGEPPPPTVTVAPALLRAVTAQGEFTGRVRPVDDVEVRARVSGHLAGVHFQNGARVKRGELLFTIDPRYYQAALSAAEAAVAEARVRVENTEREAQRAQQLLASQAISAEEAEGRSARLAEARAALLAAEARVEAARLDLAYTRIESPIDGRVDRALVTPGNFVGGPAQVLTTLVSIDPVFVDADVDEASLLCIRQALVAGLLPLDEDGRAHVELGLSDQPGYPYEGALDSLANRLDPTTSTIVLRVLVADPEARFLPGMFVRVRVPLGAAEPSVLISERAIGTDQSQRFVLVLGADGTLAYRVIELGPLLGGERVIRRGLAAGEEVVVNGLQRVRPGMRVTVQREDGAAAAAAAQ